MTRRLLYSIHLWLSLPLGIIVMLICLSGATLVFKAEIRNALGMPKVVAPHGHHASKAGRTAKPFDGGRKGAVAHGKSKDAPYGVTTKRDFFSYVTKFHTSLMAGSVGKAVVAYTTLLLILILISGLWICLPRNDRQWRQRFSIERRRGRQRLLFDLHVSLGYWVVLWLLLLAVTGVCFGLHLVPKGTAAMRVLHELHVGSWGGTVTKAITFAVSIVGATLPATGYWLYFRKHFRR